MAHIWVIERKLPQWKAWKAVAFFSSLRKARIYLCSSKGVYPYRITKYVPKGADK